MWVMSSKRYKGMFGNPPRVEFKIGEVTIANIVMTGGKPGGPWTFKLETAPAWADSTTYNSFGEALAELHRQLNSPSPDDFEVS